MQQVKKIQSEFSKSLKNWHDMLWDFNYACEKNQIKPERYSDEDLMYATKIFMEVLSNIQIHRMMDKKTKLKTACVMQEDLGAELKNFIKKWTGIDTTKFYK